MKRVIILVGLVVGLNAFNFPTDTGAPPPPPPAAGAPLAVAADDPFSLGRQGFPNNTFPAGVITPAIVTPTNSCICVPTGSCTFGTVGGNTDGTGLIDIRIVNSVATVTTAPVISIASTVTAAANPILATASQTTCGTNLQLCCYAGSYQCGVRFPPITGALTPQAGQAPYGAYPWQAVLLGTGDVYAGSGALIDNLHVLTAAHKVTPFLTGTQLRVRLGEWDAANTNEPIQPQQQVVARIFVHPSYTANNLKNDIAILRLSSPVSLGQFPTIGTACLAQQAFVGSRCYVSGWGKNDFSNTGAYQAIQKEVDVPVLANAQCETQLRATRLGASFVFDTLSFMCAGGEANKDACTGDGGSPLVCLSNNRWYVAGLVAWGIGCGQSNVPGVYVNVANYISWIQTTVRTT